MVVRIKYT